MFTRNLLKTLITTEPLNSLINLLNLILLTYFYIVCVLVSLLLLVELEVRVDAICEMCLLWYVSVYANSGRCNTRFPEFIST